VKRKKVDQADWHITLRGARRLLLFHDPEDFQTFYSLLGFSCEKSGMDHVANCLMSNHFHLSLNGSSSQLTKCMWHLDRQYSRYHNDKYDLSGHAFEQAYYCEPIPSKFILQRVVRYIHLNPVRARLVRTPEAYRWSSYPRLMHSPVQVLGPSERRFLECFNPDLALARSEYAALVEKGMRRRHSRRAAKSSAWEIWQEQFSWFLEFARELTVQLHPLEPETVAAWLAVKSGIPPRVIGKALGHADGRQVSQICFRLSERLERDPILNSRIYDLGAL
jgi:REP element-mobilizing transposase RayT